MRIDRSFRAQCAWGNERVLPRSCLARRCQASLYDECVAMCAGFSITVTGPEAFQVRWRIPLERWMDGIEEGWAIPLLLLGFVAIWQVYFSIAYAGGDLHPDVLETWTLGRSLEWGYSKHPPLMG